MRRLAFVAAVAGALALAACAALLPPANPGYVVCNETGNDTGCGDNVVINVE